MSAEMAAAARGTATSPGELAERFDVPIEDVEELLLDHEVEACPGCGWWFDSCMLNEADHGDPVCDDCAVQDDEP